ncbi:hypothetical protein I4U23_027699 [Adineta vaga]|nr:hypothetical protein I4U23_027699 [Adineta vaga]
MKLNSVLVSMSAGKPMLVLPMFGDQFFNGHRIEYEFGTGRVIPNTKSNGHQRLVLADEINQYIQQILDPTTSHNEKAQQLQTIFSSFTMNESKESTNSTSTTITSESSKIIDNVWQTRATQEISNNNSTNNDTQSTHPIQFTSEALRVHLEPVIHTMIAFKASSPFRLPIDPIELNFLDYSTIIKHPMDILTMQNKLKRGEYKNPVEFCDDAWLMFNNAWLYNKKTTRIYRMSTELSEVFARAIKPIIQRLGYCCGQQYTYLPQNLLCYGNQSSCQILPDENYYYYYYHPKPESLHSNLSNDKYTFCSQCFDSVQGDKIFVGNDSTQTLIEISKSLFSSARNDGNEPEAIVHCIVCSRRWHEICALHLNQISSEGFICPTCVHEYKIERKDNRYKASKLTKNNLEVTLEQRVKNFLISKSCHTGHVTIRVLSAKIDGVDVVFFGMHVQEYNDCCQAPNTRRVYISFIDFLDYFQPEIYRTDIYHEILIGYLDYIKQLGYISVHIWAYPSSKENDYIFYRHPSLQRILSPKQFRDWFKDMLIKAIAEHVVIDYKNIMEDVLENQDNNVYNIPYFEGDFWPIIIEQAIKELDEEEDQREHQMDDTEDSTNNSGKRKSSNVHKEEKLMKTALSQQRIEKNQPSNCTDLMSKILSTMGKYKQEFLVIRLYNQMVLYPTLNDTDALIQCHLMKTRETFLNFSRNKHLEFSSLRRAKFSTMNLLYELHTSAIERSSHNCNACQQQYEKCYHIESKHEDEMEHSSPLNVENYDQNCSDTNEKSMTSSQLESQQRMERCIQSLLHAVNCRDVLCVTRPCYRYKRVIQHTREYIEAAWAVVPAIASLATPILKAIHDNIKHMGKSHATYLELINDSNGGLQIEVSEVDNYDWDGKSRPDHTFQRVVIPRYKSVKRRQEINAKSRSAMSTMKFRFRGKPAFSMRIDQWAALSDKVHEKTFKLENGWTAHMKAGINKNTLQYKFRKG